MLKLSILAKDVCGLVQFHINRWFISSSPMSVSYLKEVIRDVLIIDQHLESVVSSHIDTAFDAKTSEHSIGNKDKYFNFRV